MDLFILIATCAINLLLGAVVFVQNKRGGMQRAFGALTVTICLWIVANYLANNPIGSAVATADIANRLAFAFAMLVIFSALMFSYLFPLKRKTSKAEVAGLGASCLLVTGLSLTTWVSGEVTHDAAGNLNFSIGPLVWLYIALFLLAIGFIVRNLLYTPGIRDRKARKQAVHVMLAICVTAILGLVMNVILPLITAGWHTTQYGPLATVILVGSISYQIIRRGLFDVRLATVRTISYAGSLLTLSVAYYLFAYMVSIVLLGGHVATSVSVSPLNILLALVLAFLFQPVRRFFDQMTNSVFYRHSYDSDAFHIRFSQLLAAGTDLRALLERASLEIAETLKVEQAFFYLHYAENTFTHHMSAGTRGHGKLPAHDAALLDEYVARTSITMLVTELLPDQERVLRRMLASHRVALVMPLRHENEISGYLLLGDHLSGGYTKRDLATLASVSDELIIAIRNALAVHTIKVINASLEQRIESATKELQSSNARLKHLDEVKDEFMSMASHQLRTPLTSIKGYLSMLLEGDAGKLSPKQREFAMEAFNSSERMVGLISDFLNVSRLQTGRFTVEKAPFDLSATVEQEVRDLRLIAANHAITLRLNIKGQGFGVVGDEAKIRQVIMNFVDNAIYYSPANSTIVINLERVNEEAAMTVVDTGIGVPKDEQSRLFNKFFRAQNARKQRPDGTGVGLFLARRVISAHAGTLIFSSEEGKGSTFGFRLPLHAPGSVDAANKDS